RNLTSPRNLRERFLHFLTSHESLPALLPQSARSCRVRSVCSFGCERRIIIRNTREAGMSAIRTIYARVFAVSVATFLAAWPSEVGAQQLGIGPSDIGGVVTGANGPEAGVWVIAETTGLGTRRYAKIVVTDEQGRYLLPALPSGAQYNLWVRGFGLVDSRRVPAKPGMTLNLTAAVAPNARAAAQY